MDEFKPVNASEWQESRIYDWQLRKIEKLAETLPIRFRDLENLVGKKIREMNRKEGMETIDRLIGMRIEKAKAREVLASRESLEQLERKFRKVGNIKVREY